MANPPLLELRSLACNKQKGQPIFANVDITVNEGDVLVLQGKSGSGKSTLLKSIAHLNIYEGDVLYRGKTPQSYGIPHFRTRVMYVPQRASLLPGTPRDFLAAVSAFGVHASRRPAAPGAGAKDVVDGEHPAFTTADDWGIQRELWDRTWVNLSGGEAQRIVLAIAAGIRSAEVLLLDEPTSALDSESSAAIEKTLVAEVKSQDSDLKAIVWITHSPEQGQRVGTRFIRITAGGVHEDSVDPHAQV